MQSRRRALRDDFLYLLRTIMCIHWKHWDERGCKSAISCMAQWHNDPETSEAVRIVKSRIGIIY
jgi:hypothetical protein